MTMDWKKILIAVYVIGAIAAGAVLANMPAEDPAVTKAKQEAEAAKAETGAEIEKLTLQLQDTESKLSEAETANTTLETEKADLEKQLNDMKVAEEEAARKAEEEKAKEEKEKAKKEKAEKKKSKEKKKETKKTGTYYTYKVNIQSGNLKLYTTKSGETQESRVPKGYKGYVISKGSDSDARALILYKGKLYYASKSLLDIKKIDADDYPDKVAKLTADDIGEKFFDGKAVGIEKNN